MGDINIGRMTPLEWNMFVVVLSETEPEKIKNRIKEAYNDYYFQLSQDCFLISSPGKAQDVSIEIGLQDPSNDDKGIVFKLNGSYSGRHYNDVWNWLYQAEVRNGRGELEPNT